MYTFKAIIDQLHGSNFGDINQMGIVNMFKESEFFLHNIFGNELQIWVPHSPPHRTAIRSTSSFSLDDLAALYL